MSEPLSRGALLRRTSATALALLGIASTKGAFAQTLRPMTIGVLAPADISGEPYYAVARGYFKAAGYDVTIEPLANGAATISAVVGGHFDVAYSNMLSIAIAHGKGIDIAILAPANLHVHESPTTGILLVKGSSPYHSAKDLNGKLFAVEGLANIAEISARTWMDKNGGDSSTVKFIETPGAAMPAAILAERVDAAVINAIYDTTVGKPDDPFRRLASSTFDAISYRWAPSVWVSSTRWIAEHPDAARAFVRVMRQTADWANKNQALSADILAEYTKQTPAEIQRIRRVTYGTTITPALIQPGIDAAAKYGMISASFPATDIIASTDAPRR